MSGLFNLNTGYVSQISPEAGVSNLEGNLALITQYDIIDQDGNGIGFIQSFNPSDNRPVTKIRAIGSADAGRALESAPSFSDITISVTGFALYNKQQDGSIVQRLGGGSTRRAMKMLEEQKIPFRIMEREVDPATKETIDATLYYGCWLTNHQKPRNISNMTIAETATISVEGAIKAENFRNL